MLDKLFAKENFMEILIECLKKKKGESLPIIKKYKKLGNEDKMELAYMVGLIHGIDEGIFGKEEALKFLKNVKEAYILMGQKKVLEKLGGK